MHETVVVPEVALRVAERLRTLGGVAAVVLGGSAARGVADARSDIDLGLYYNPARPFAVSALREIARELDDRHAADLVTDFGGWGRPPAASACRARNAMSGCAPLAR